VAVVRNLMVRSGADFSALYREMSNAQKRMTGFQKGLKKAMRGLSVVLGGLAIGKLVKDSLSAASELEGAFVGLESILTGQGKSFSRAQGFINDYIQDGLIPLTDAITAYKNLAARGYDDTQIQQTLERLKDAAAFGRQSSYTLGEAVRTATEGLKNENSILVDNAGVTKNVSKMWDEYAKAIGKNRNQLTQQEKIQAEVNGILQETQWQVGDAAKYADTYAGRLAALGKVLRDIKINLGNAFMPIANIVLPLLQSLAGWLSRVTATLAAFSQALFGKAPKAQAKATQEQADAIAELGDATEEAGKQAKGAVTGFDEINQLGQTEMSGITVGAGALPVETLTAGLDDSNSGVLEQVAGKAEEMAQKVRAAFTTMKNAIVENKNIIVPAIGAIGGALAGLAAFQAVTGLIGQFTRLKAAISIAWEALAANPVMLVVIAVGALIGALVAAYKNNEQFRETVDKLWSRIKTALTPVVEALGQGLTWLWQNVIKPLGRVIADVLVTAFDALVQVAQWLWQYVLEPLGKFIVESLAPAFIEIGKIVGQVFKKHIEDLIKVLEFLWYDVLKPIVLWLADTFKPVFETIGDSIKTIIGGLQTTFKGLINFILGVFTGDWKRAWEGVKQIFKGVFDSLWGIVKAPLNLIIDGINWVIGGLNKISFSLPSWIPGVGGRTFGINIPKIPKLATGGVVDSPTIAMIGEGRYPEAVVPLGRSPQMKDLVSQVAVAVQRDGTDDKGDTAGTTHWPTLRPLGGGIKEIMQGLRSALDRLVRFASGGSAGNTETALSSAKQVITAAVDNFSAIVKTPLNLTVDITNRVASGLNKVHLEQPKWNVDGKSPGISIPKIPKLATGGVVDSPTIAMIGEGRYPEAVVPLGRSPQMKDLVSQVAVAVQRDGTDDKGDTAGTTHWPTLRPLGGGIKEIMQGLRSALDRLVRFASGGSAGNTETALSSAKQVITAAVDNFSAIVKTPLNLTVDITNRVASGLNKVHLEQPKWNVDGKSPGISIPKIPKLATGGVVDSPTIAMIGDNPGGREVVAPLDDLIGMIKAALQEGGGSANLNLTVKIGEDTITEKVINNINRRSRINGETAIVV
jgi:phage-related protein